MHILNGRLHILPAIGLCLLGFTLAGSVRADAGAAAPIQILLVGVDHLGKKHDVHNSPNIDPLSPAHQAEIKEVIGRIARFKPTKVMIEHDYQDPKTTADYQQYLQGKFELGPNEIYQYGFRLAALAHNPAIYCIDAIQDFPFGYQDLLDSADKHGQKTILDAAEADMAPYLSKLDDLTLHGSVGDVLRYVNEPASLAASNGWYLYATRVGGDTDYAGAKLVSTWYARNVYIFTNVMRQAAPGDRVVIFIGAGHVPSLKWLIQQSPDLELMDTESYLN